MKPPFPRTFTLAMGLIMAAFPMQPLWAFDHQYKNYGKVLSKFVEGDSGMVHYRQWQHDSRGMKTLASFLQEIATLEKADYDQFSHDQKLAFWLNVYNVLAIKSVLDHYPVKQSVDYFPSNSIRQFNDGWEVLYFTVMGQNTTLYDIEHEKLRHGFRDPRVHFAVASASIDSAQLSKKPFVAEGLDERLDSLAHKFFLSPSAYKLDRQKNTVEVSKIFNWFTLDFAARAGFKKTVFPPPKDEDIVLNFVELYLPTAQKEALQEARASGKLAFDYLPYDWTLNDAD